MPVLGRSSGHDDERELTVMYVLHLLELALLAGLTVSLWTVRVALTARRRRYAGALVATVEALVFATVFARVIESVDSPVQLAAYGVGVGAGTLVGLAIEERGAPLGRAQRESTDADRPAEGDVVDPSRLTITSGCQARQDAVADRGGPEIVGSVGRVQPRFRRVSDHVRDDEAHSAFTR